jgi:hypothetical protein
VPDGEYIDDVPYRVDRAIVTRMKVAVISSIDLDRYPAKTSYRIGVLPLTRLLLLRIKVYEFSTRSRIISV